VRRGASGAPSYREEPCRASRSIPTSTARSCPVLLALDQELGDRTFSRNAPRRPITSACSLEPRPESSVRRRRWGKVLVYVGLAFMAIGAPKLVTHNAITVALALGVLLVLIGTWMRGSARMTPVLPPPAPE